MGEICQCVRNREAKNETEKYKCGLERQKIKKICELIHKSCQLVTIFYQFFSYVTGNLPEDISLEHGLISTSPPPCSWIYLKEPSFHLSVIMQCLNTDIFITNITLIQHYLN